MVIVDEKKPDLTFVRWVDSYGVTSEWTEKHEAIKSTLCWIETVGTIIEETPDAIYIAGSVDLITGQVLGLMVIPVCAIRERYKLTKEVEDIKPERGDSVVITQLVCNKNLNSLCNCVNCYPLDERPQKPSEENPLGFSVNEIAKRDKARDEGKL